MLVCKQQAFFLALTQTEVCNRSQPGESGAIPARRVFLPGRIPGRAVFLGKAFEFGRGWLITCKFTTDLRNTRKVNPRNPAVLRGTFSLEKEKRVREGVGRIACKFTITLNPGRILPEKSQGKRSQSHPPFFLKKKKDFRERSAAPHVNLQSH